MSYYSANTNSIKSGSVQNTRTLGYPASFGGIELSAPARAISPNRFAYALNMWKDYHDESGACIQTFPGWRQIQKNRISGTVHGIFRFNEYVMVHAGTRLYAFPHEERDTGGLYILASDLEERESCGFVCNGNFYLLDGAWYRRIRKVNTVQEFDVYKITSSQNQEVIPYVPQMYASHTPTKGTGPDQYEQRNMLTQLFKESWVVGMDEAVDITAPDCARFSVDSADKKTCVVSSAEAGSGVTWTIPGNRIINGETYQVRRIGRFVPNTSVTTLIIGEGVEEISDSAFYGFTGLTKIVLPNTLKYIASNAFGSTPANLNVYLDVTGTKQIGTAIVSELIVHTTAFSPSLTRHGTIHYYGSEDSLDEIKYDDTTYEAYFSENHWTRDCWATRQPGFHNKYIIPLASPLVNIASVLVSGKQIYSTTSDNIYFEKVTYDGVANQLMIATKNDDALFGKTITVTATTREGNFTVNGATETYQECINHCTKAVEYDGRIFFYGNPKFPNIVWYTQRDLQGVNRAEYVGELNYWQDGAAGAQNVSALATGSVLMMFSRTTDGSGGVFMHTGETSDSNLTPRIYPSVYGNTERAPYAACCSFFDDPIYLTSRGVDAIARQQINTERAVEHRSSNVDALLVGEDLEHAKMCEFDGYALVVCPSGRVFMADSRQMFRHAEGHVQYEWYLIDGFDNVTALLSTGDVLYFAKAGKLYTLNTDKRGIAFDGEAVDAGQIHREWYTRDGSPIDTQLLTRYDDCGYPHVNKNTVRLSVDIELKCDSMSLPTFSWRTDRCELWREEQLRNRFNVAAEDFGNATIGAVPAHVYVSDEHAKLWIFKQYMLSADATKAPWGLYHISYRWHVGRRIKNL